MLSKEEEAFIVYWEQNRLRRKKIVRQFLLGIPIGLLFIIPIAINFMSGWDKRAGMEANSPDFDPRVLFVALLLIVGFTAVFYQRHRWDQYEQRYRELLARRQREQPKAAAQETVAQPPQEARQEPSPEGEGAKKSPGGDQGSSR